MKISLVIPTYEMHGVGVQMLERSLESLEQQSFKDFEVIISDNSDDHAIENLIKDFKDLDLKYFRNPIKGMATNTNYGMKQSQGELIKVLYQDDYLATSSSLQEITDNFSPADNWLVTACSNNPYPFYSENRNTLGSPSCLTIRNEDPLLFNENLKWVLDLDYYKRMNRKYGVPKVLNVIGVIMGIGDHQDTNHLSNEIKQNEENLVNWS